MRMRVAVSKPENSTMEALIFGCKTETVSAPNSYWFCDGLKVIWDLNLAC